MGLAVMDDDKPQPAANEAKIDGRSLVVRRRKSRDHKTRAKLLETAAALLKKYELADITSYMVLKHSGISRGSLYYHFADFDELMGEAAIQRYAKWADQEANKLQTAMSNAGNVPAMVESLVTIIGELQTDRHRSQRLDHAVLIAQTKTNSYFADLVAQEQSRLTHRIATIVTRAQATGVISSQSDAMAIAMFLQVCAFGRLLDDVSGALVDTASWDSLLAQVLSQVLSGPN